MAPQYLETTRPVRRVVIADHLIKEVELTERWESHRGTFDLKRADLRRLTGWVVPKGKRFMSDLEILELAHERMLNCETGVAVTVVDDSEMTKLIVRRAGVTVEIILNVEYSKHLQMMEKLDWSQSVRPAR